MTAGEAVAELTHRFQAAGIDTSKLDARILVAHVMGVAVEKVFGYPETELSKAEQDDLLQVTKRRANREPLARITGEKEFWSLVFKVSNETLVPRPDSECLVEAVLDHIGERSKKLNILDLGTGTGCLIISLLHEMPNVRGVGIDISPGALGTATENAKFLNVSNRVSFKGNDWCVGLVAEFDQGFDIIISNPPYIPSNDISSLEPEVSKYEPLRALAGGEDGLDAYRLLVVDANPLLKQGGILALEVGCSQADDVVQLGRAEGFYLINIKKDLAGIARCVVFKKR